MKELIVAALVAFAVPSQAAYFRLVGADGHVHQSASVLIDPTGANSPAQVTDIALVTHSTADGSIIPVKWRSVLPHENWSPLELGFGGSAHISGGHVVGNALGEVGSSVNIAPQIGALILAKVGASSPPWMQAVKGAMLGVNGSGVRIGGGLAADAIKDGRFQSFREMFNQQGLLPNLAHSARIKVGVSWSW